MYPRPTLTRTLATLLAAGTGLALLAASAPAGASPRGAVAPTRAEAPAAPAALNDNGPFSATAQASLLTLDVPALSPALLPQTNVDLAPSAAQADSDADLDADKAG